MQNTVLPSGESPFILRKTTLPGPTVPYTAVTAYEWILLTGSTRAVTVSPVVQLKLRTFKLRTKSMGTSESVQPVLGNRRVSTLYINGQLSKYYLLNLAINL